MIYTSEVLKSDIDGVISKILKFEKRLKSAINYTISESFWVYDKDYGMLEKVTIDADIPDIEYVKPGYKVVAIINYSNMFDNKFRVFIWFTSTSIGNLCIGQKYKMLGKVKKHNVFNNIKQNIMTHCKIIDI